MSSCSKGLCDGRSLALPPPAFCDPDGPECCDDDLVDGVQMSEQGKLKSSCEECAVAKVRCSGHMPCERCVKKKVSCEYKIEKKRGRRAQYKQQKVICSSESCWGQVIMNPISKTEDFGAKFGLESVERRLFQTFFSIYKHHATAHSCCKEWFTYQLNKMSTFLTSNGNFEGQQKLDSWMLRKGIELRARDPQNYAKIPANVIDEVTGKSLPPIHPLKGPQMSVMEPKAQKRRKREGTVYSNRGLYMDDDSSAPIDFEIDRMKSTCFLSLRSTHENFVVDVNDEFTALFGHTTQQIVILMERLFGGLLPWGCDILALILANDADLLFMMRLLALKFNAVGRPESFPATRQVFSANVFDFETRAGDIVECLLKCVHRECLSMDRTEVEIFIGIEPMMPDVPRKFINLVSTNQTYAIQSKPGFDSTDNHEVDLPKQEPIDNEATSQSNMNHTPSTFDDPEYMDDLEEYPENSYEGLDFLDSMLDWVGDDNVQESEEL